MEYENNLEMGSKILENEEEDHKKLNINIVYRKYIDIYLHLDKLRWTFSAGTLILSIGMIGITKIFSNSSLFFAIFGFILIIIALIINLYRKTIRKFVLGQDFISYLIAEMEANNKHIFNKEILSPKEGRKFISYFFRKRQIISEDILKYNDEGIIEDRQIRKYQTILKHLATALFFLGGFVILLNIGYLIMTEWRIISQIIDIIINKIF